MIVTDEEVDAFRHAYKALNKEEVLLRIDVRVALEAALKVRKRLKRERKAAQESSS